MPAKNPRRVVVEQLRLLMKDIRGLLPHWNLSMTKHDGIGWRQRTEDEKPENKRDEWVWVARFMEAIEHRAASLRNYAQARIEEIDRKEANDA